MPQTTTVPVVRRRDVPKKAGDGLWNSGVRREAEGVTGYVSATPTGLRRIRWTALGCLTLWAGCSLAALSSIALTTKTIGHDTSASIVAAERVRSLLADANGNFANVLLVGDADDGPFMSAFRQDVRDAMTALAQAAQNVTYGEEETGPIVTMMRGAAEYEHLVGQARGAGGTAGHKASPADAKAADTLMHFTILPAAAALDRVNFEHLTESYLRHRTLAPLTLTAMGLIGLVSLGVLGAAQYWLFRRTKRLLNPGLAAATGVILLVGLWSLAAAIRAEEQIRVAKADAFDSVSALSAAQSVANDANAAESFWLLAHGDATAQDRWAKLFAARSARLVAVPVAQAKTETAAGRKFGGYLGDELANITFTGEKAAADATLAAWGDYLTIDRRIRDLEGAGRTAEAVDLDVGSKEGQSNWAFARFNNALARVTEINQRAFEGAVAASEGLVDTTLLGCVAVAWLLACLGVWIGASMS